jgi:hypothetical protein
VTVPVAPTSLVADNPQLSPGLEGIDFVAFDEAGSVLRVTFKRPVAPFAYLMQTNSYALVGGRRIVPRITAARPMDPLTVGLALDKTGDFSNYTLIVSGPDIDPFFATAPVRFRVDCDAPFDCQTPAAPPVAAAGERPAIDYLTKDYLGFRQALLDFVGTRFPGWKERNEADLGIMLLELMAATADTLSYQQDRVGSEAFLSTATQRRSIADHLALVGYHLDEGACAWTFLQFTVGAAKTLTADAPLVVGDHPLDPQVVFETSGSAQLDPNFNAFTLYTWGQDPSLCTLPRGALSAELVGQHDGLRNGDYLAFVRGDTADVVRLVADASVVTAATGTYTRVRWSALTPLHADYLVPPTVVHGNIVPARHGQTVVDEYVPPDQLRTHADSGDLQVDWREAHSRVRLSQAPLGFSDLDALRMGQIGAPIMPTGFLDRERRSAPDLSLTVIDAAGEPEQWTERVSLLEGPPDARAFSVKVAADGTATLLFGDGAFTVALPRQAHLVARYRVGGGAVGNVAQGILTAVVSDPGGSVDWCQSVVNVVPATGGRDRESVDHARQFGPSTIPQPRVAITAEDYSRAAQAVTDASGTPLVQRANASFRWTGSWLTVTLAVDPLASETFDDVLHDQVTQALEARRLAGYDLQVVGATYVPLEVGVELCVRPEASGSQVAQQVEVALEHFFAPENFTFGDAVFVSRLFDVIMAVPGVASARIARLAHDRAARADAETAANLAAGALRVQPEEIVQLDNDRNFPERGTLTVSVAGVAAA